MPPTQEPTGNDSDQTQDTGSHSNGDESPPKWFLDFQADVDSRLNGIDQKFSKKLPDQAPKKKEEPKPDNGSAAAWMGVEYGSLREKLPEKVRSRLDGMAREGDLAQAHQLASLLAEFASDGPPQPSGPASQPPPGRAPIPASNNAPRHPKTQAEWLDLRKRSHNDPRAMDRWRELEKDDSFQPGELPAY